LPALPGFEKINRFWNKQNNEFMAKILPGEYYVTTHNEKISTVLGSCISACVRCTLFNIGGMNHFMLPMDPDMSVNSWSVTTVSGSARYGGYAMEKMINDILRFGGSRKHLEVKVVGGAQMLSINSNIGDRNIDFIMEYITLENLNLSGKDVGDIYPRKVVYDPKTGKLLVKKLIKLANNTIVEREKKYHHQLAEQPSSGDVELF
jgi:chemotaxis protein CheD